MSSALSDAVALRQQSGNFVSWSADDFTNDTSLIVSSDRWIFQLSVNEYEKLLQLCKFTARQVVLYKQKIGESVCYCYVQFNGKRDVDKMFIDQLAILKLFKPVSVEVEVKLYIPPNLIYYVLYPNSWFCSTGDMQKK